MYLLKNQGIIKFLGTFFLCFGLIALGHNASAQADVAKGKELFAGNCASCHGVGDKAVVGPGLKGVHERRNEAWLLKWIKNSSAVIASGDAYAVALYNQYGKAQMQSFPDLKDDDIKNILAYVKAEGDKPVVAVECQQLVVRQQQAEMVAVVAIITSFWRVWSLRFFWCL